MSTLAIKTDYTIDDLLAMPDRKNYELVEGQLVEVHGRHLSALDLCPPRPVARIAP